MKALLIVFFCLCSLSFFAQNAKIDSLKKVIATTKTDTARGRSYARLGEVYAMQGDFERALETAQKGLAIAQKGKDMLGLGLCNQAIGNIYKKKSNYSLALNHYHTGLKHYEKLNDRIKIANIYFLIGSAYYDQKNIQYALESINKSLKISTEIRDNKSIARSLSVLGIIYDYKGDRSLAIDYYLQSIRRFEQLGNKEQVAQQYFNVGLTYYNIGNYIEALMYFQRSLKIAQELQNDEQIAGALTAIGMVYHFQKEYVNAIDHYQNGLKYYQKIKDKFGMLGALVNLGIAYKDSRHPDKAILCFDQGLLLAKQIDDHQRIADIYNDMAIIYIDAHDYDKALSYLQNGLVISEEINDQAGIANNLTNTARVFIETGKLKQSKEKALRAYEIATAIKELKTLTDASWRLYQADSALINYQSALNYYKIFKAFSDSLHNEDKAKEFGRLEAKYQYDKEKEAHAREEAVAAEKRTWIAFTTGGGIVILLSFMGVLYKNYREKKRINQQLLEQNEEISSQNEQIALQRDELNSYNSKLLENNALLNEQNEEIRAQSEQISQQRDQLEQTNAQLKALDEFKEAMAGMIVHDLKNPLNAIIGLSAKTDLRENDRVMIHQAGKQMLNLTLNILDVQKFEQADVPLNLQDHPLADIASDAFAQVSLLATNKNLKLILEIESGTGVHADFELISRVFMNLLTNAIKYTPNNGKITISAEKTDHQIRIGVSDTGQGIPADKLHTVFDKFSQVEAKKSGIARSTGLGLTFCKMVVEAHGGRIGVTSEVGIGTTFYFNLPEAHSKVTATEQPIEMIKETLELNEEDKNVLVEYLPALQALDVYEGSEVLQILASITGSPAVHGWKNEIENAIFSSNQERYEELVRI